jgi:hypothetical protein
MNFAIFCVLLALALIAVTAWLLDWELIDDWRLWWRKWSTWLAGGNAALWAQLTDSSGKLLGFVGYIPDKYRPYAVLLVFVFTWAIPVLAAHIRQVKLSSAGTNGAS